jgi:hypothetical protein
VAGSLYIPTLRSARRRIVGTAVRGLVDVAYRPRFGGDSQVRTPQLSETSWKGSAGQGPAIRTRQALVRQEFPYVYKYQLATQVE